MRSAFRTDEPFEQAYCAILVGKDQIGYSNFKAGFGRSSEWVPLLHDRMFRAGSGNSAILPRASLYGSGRTDQILFCLD